MHMGLSFQLPVLSFQLDSHRGHRSHRLWVMALGLQTNVLICGYMIRTDVWIVKAKASLDNRINEILLLLFPVRPSLSEK